MEVKIISVTEKSPLYFENYMNDSANNALL